jgi:hypothetical protein
LKEKIATIRTHDSREKLYHLYKKITEDAKPKDRQERPIEELRNGAVAYLLSDKYHKLSLIEQQQIKQMLDLDLADELKQNNFILKALGVLASPYTGAALENFNELFENFKSDYELTKQAKSLYATLKSGVEECISLVSSCSLFSKEPTIPPIESFIKDIEEIRRNGQQRETNHAEFGSFRGSFSIN